MRIGISIPGRRSSGGSAPDPEITPVSIAIASDGVTLTVTYGEALDTAYQSAVGSWAVTVAGVLRTVNAVSVPGGATVVLTLASPVFVGQVTTLTYAQGANAVRSLADGHLAANFGPAAVDTSAAWDFGSVAGLILDADPANFSHAGGVVTAALDSSGVGNEITVADGDVTYIESDPDFAGKPSIASDGAGYIRCEALVGGPSEAPRTLYTVVKMPPGDSGAFFFADVNPLRNPKIRVTAATPTTDFWRIYDDGGAANSDGAAQAEYDSVGILRVAWHDGVIDVRWSPFGGEPIESNGHEFTSPNPLTGISLLADGNGTGHYTGKVARPPIIYDSHVDGADDDAVMAKLTDLYS